VTAARAASADAPEAGPPSPPEALATLRRLRRDDLDTDQQAAVDRLCAGMAEPHPAFLALSRDPPDVEALSDIVRRDPGLTAEVLRTVNSAAFALSSPIASVQHAVTYLGMSTVQGIIAGAAASGRAPAYSDKQRAALGRIIRASAVAATTGQLLAQACGDTRSSLVATRSLFANLGDLAFLESEPAAVNWYMHRSTFIDRLRWQQQATAIDSPLLGAALAERWALPPDIVSAIEGGAELLLAPADDESLHGAGLGDRLIIYCASRIGDRVAFRGLRDVAEFDPRDSDDPECWFLPNALAAAGLTGLPALLKDASFRRRANKQLEPWFD
jgi:HD-like signal output (HDOD) protein